LLEYLGPSQQKPVHLPLSLESPLFGDGFTKRLTNQSPTRFKTLGAMVSSICPYSEGAPVLQV